MRVVRWILGYGLVAVVPLLAALVLAALGSRGPEPQDGAPPIAPRHASGCRACQLEQLLRAPFDPDEGRALQNRVFNPRVDQTD